MTAALPCSASVLLPGSGPAPLLEMLVAEMNRHSMDVSRLSPVEALLNLDGNFVRLKIRDGEGLLVTIEAEGVVPLHRIKQWLLEHLEELLPGRTNGLRWSDDLERTGEIPPPYFHELTVLRKRALSPLLLRLTFRVDGMDRLGRDGIHVKLLLPPEGRKPVWPTLALNGGLNLPDGEDALCLRYYTLRAVRPEASEIDIDIVRHRGGVVSDWAETCGPGAVTGLLGPSGFQHPPLAGPLLIAADSTAAPAAARIIEALAEDAARSGTAVSGGGHVFLGLGTDEEAFAYLDGLDLSALGLSIHGLAPETFDAEIEPAIRAAFDQAPPAFAWFAGEQQTAQSLRALFRKSFGLGKGSQYAIAYWTRDETPGGHL